MRWTAAENCGNQNQCNIYVKNDYKNIVIKIIDFT